MNILLVEDDKPKLQSILAFLRNNFPDSNIMEAYSVNSAMCILEEEIVDLALLDMSLPTYDINADEGGGKSQRFGGEEVLDFIEFLEKQVSVLIITQYRRFSDDDLNGNTLNLRYLEDKYSSRYPKIFKGIIHYDGSAIKWQKELREYVNVNSKD